MQSQRYCEFKEDFEYITPDSIKKNFECLEGYVKVMKTLADCYRVFINSGIPAEDARYLLPNAASTNLTVTLNVRQLMHIAHERCCTSAQWEIRNLVNKMVEAVVKELPFLKTYLVPKCEWLGYCTESKEKSCGRKKTKK
jgi:thymidylate synthase (FAD)